MPTLDYIKIVGISEISTDDPDSLDVTFNIEHSEDAEFGSPKRGIITIRLSELIDTEGFSNQDIEQIVNRLMGQILMREKDEEGNIIIMHVAGSRLRDWIVESMPFLNQ